MMTEIGMECMIAAFERPLTASMPHFCRRREVGWYPDGSIRDSLVSPPGFEPGTY